MSAPPNLVQELVQEMGPNNPALSSAPAYSNQGMHPGMNPMLGPQPTPGMGGAMTPVSAYPSQMPHGGMAPPPQQCGAPMGGMGGMGMGMQQPMMTGPMAGEMSPEMQHQMMMAQQQQQQDEYQQQLSDAQQMQEMMDMSNFGMDGQHQSVTDRLMDQAKELAFIALAFFALSLPQVDQTLTRFVPQLGANFYYLLAVKGALLAILFYAARFFELI